jgi:hypothetical protein
MHDHLQLKEKYRRQFIAKAYPQSGWKRLLLLAVLAYEGLGALVGGVMLMYRPDGALMKMPVAIMHGTFSDFLIPGIILFALGILTTIGFFMVLSRKRPQWWVASIAVFGLLIWFWIEIAILQQLHWLHAMWGLPVVAGVYAVVPLIPSRFRELLLLSCGISSSILYVAINLIVANQWRGYSYAPQVVSELSAVGAPTRFLWTILSTPYTFLMIAFGWGVLRAAAKNARLRVVGKLLIAYGGVGLLWPFVPMHLPATLAAGGGTFSDTLHIVLGVITEVLYVLCLIFGAVSLSATFKWYSVVTLVLVLMFGILTFIEAPGLANNVPLRLIGLWERFNIALLLAWISVLSIILLRKALSTQQPRQSH